MVAQDDNIVNEMKWPDQNEAAFLTILYERVKKDPNGAPSFKARDWHEMDYELSRITGERYGTQRLQGKFNRLRIKHRQFSELLEHVEVTFDLSTNTVVAPEDVWQMFYKKHKIFKSFKKTGCKNYTLLCQVFDKYAALGLLHYAATRFPPNSGDERQNEFENEPDKSSGGSTSKGKRVADEMITRKGLKTARLDKLDSCLDLWASPLNLRSEYMAAEMKRTEQETSTMSTCMLDPYSVEKCMQMLSSVPNVSHKAYVTAAKELMSPDWRIAFVNMPNDTREWWVRSLE